MAKLKKNGNLSGAIGNLVFVNDSENPYVRSKGKKPNQTQNTRNAYTAFGMVSTLDKEYRDALMQITTLNTSPRYAASHRTRLRLTSLQTDNPQNKVQLEYRNPQFLVGYNFNKDLEWEKCCLFFPGFQESNNGQIIIKIPTLSWGKEIKAPPKATKAEINFTVITTNLNAPKIAVEKTASFNIKLTASEKVEFQNFTFNMPLEKGWILVIGTINFSSPQNNIKHELRGASVYLWAKSYE